MSTTLNWVLDCAGRCFTNIWGAAIPVSIFFEITMEPAHREQNPVMALLQGTFALVGHVMIASVLGALLNTPLPEYSSSVPALALVPLFLPNSIAKVKYFRRSITSLLPIWSVVSDTTAEVAKAIIEIDGDSDGDSDDGADAELSDTE